MFFKDCILSCFAGASGNPSQQLKGAAQALPSTENSLEQLGRANEADDIASAEPCQEQLRSADVICGADEPQSPSMAPGYSATPSPQNCAELRDFMRSLCESYDMRKEAELALDTLGTDPYCCDAERKSLAAVPPVHAFVQSVLHRLACVTMSSGLLQEHSRSAAASPAPRDLSTNRRRKLAGMV